MKHSKVFFNLSILISLDNGKKIEISFDSYASIHTAFMFVDKYSTNTANKQVIYSNTDRHEEYEIPANDHCFNTYANRIPNASDATLIISKI